MRKSLFSLDGVFIQKTTFKAINGVIFLIFQKNCLSNHSASKFLIFSKKYYELETNNKM